MDLFLETPQQQAERMLRQQQRLMEMQMQGAAVQPPAQNAAPAVSLAGGSVPENYSVQQDSYAQELAFDKRRARRRRLGQRLRTLAMIVHLLGLEDKLKNMPNNLSGGQQQRVAIARALITKPAIVLADEPTGNLDSKTSAEVLGLIKRTSTEFRQTVVMITHNNDIARLADRIVRIEDGKIVE